MGRGAQRQVGELRREAGRQQLTEGLEPWWAPGFYSELKGELGRRPLAVCGQ